MLQYFTPDILLAFAGQRAAHVIGKNPSAGQIVLQVVDSGMIVRAHRLPSSFRDIRTGSGQRANLSQHEYN